MSPYDYISMSDNVSNAFMHESNGHEMRLYAFCESFVSARYTLTATSKISNNT